MPTWFRFSLAFSELIEVAQSESSMDVNKKMGIKKFLADDKQDPALDVQDPSPEKEQKKAKIVKNPEDLLVREVDAKKIVPDGRELLLE